MSGRAWGYFALFSEVGFVLLVTILAGILAGYWFDQQLGTVPVFVLVGFAVGLTAGGVGVYRLIERFLSSLEE